MKSQVHTKAGRSHYDVVIVGSGVGGSLAAHVLVHAGLRVLMIERGRAVRRSDLNWEPDQALELSPHYTMESHYLLRGDDRGRVGTFQCVGGPSVFYGGVAFRMRETDFGDCQEVVRDSGAEWPYRYSDLEPYYGWAERILGVAGRDGRDATAPPRDGGYPNRAPDVAGPARLIWDAAARLRLNPSHLPLAIDFSGRSQDATPCARCGTCDGYACAISAKSEPSTAVLPELVRRGLTIVPNTVVVRLLRRGGLVVGVECLNRSTGRRHLFRADRYVLAAGALTSPHLILASGLHTSSPARDWIGRCLMRHCNGIVFGLFPRPLEGGRAFHKQVAIMDMYGGGDDPKLGCLQSIHPPPPGLVRDRVPAWLGCLAEPLANHSTGLLAIAEDEPRWENRVAISGSGTDRYGIPRAVITHHYTERDLSARRTLARAAREILREAGASITKMVRLKSFSHAVGTLRMGVDPRTSPLDWSSRFRGVQNLWVIDGSFMPRSAAVNPSLTIAANALFAAEHMVGEKVMDQPAEARWEDGRTQPLTMIGARE